MKNLVFGFLIVIGFASTGCEKENIPEFQFEATVLHKGMDCGETYLISLNNLSGDSTIINGVYYAENLPSDMLAVGLEIYLNCRYPIENELSLCTTYGPGYPHIFVINAKISE